MDELETPTGKRLSATFDHIIERLFKSGRLYDLEFAADVFGFLTELIPDADTDSRETIDMWLNMGMKNAYMLSSQEDETGELVNDVVGPIAIGTFWLVHEIACEAMKKEQKRIPNLAQYKHKRAQAEAVKQAEVEWSKDSEQELRIGQCAKIVANHLDRNDYGRYTDSKVRDWIRVCAPEYATKGGRAKKK